MNDALLAPFDADFAPHIHQRLAELRRLCPVPQVRGSTGEPTWLVLDHRDVSDCLRDPRLSVQRGQPPVRSPQAPALTVSLMNYEASQHTRVRRLAGPLFTEANLSRYRDPITATARRLLAPVRAAGEPVELMSSFAHPFVLQVLAELFGVAPADRDELFGWVSSLFGPRSDSQDSPVDTVTRIEGYLRAQLRERRDGRGRDALSLLQQSWQADGGIDEDELISLAGMLLLAGSHSTAQMIGICAIGLLGEPGLAERLRADPGLVPAAVEELLRWDTSGPFSTPRWAKTDLSVAGTVIPAGSRVIMSFLAGNHDPSRHTDPGSIDIDRPPGARNLAFGFGPHLCPGAPLARLELVIAITELVQLLDGMELACPADQLAWTGGDQQRRLACLPIRRTS